MSTHDHRSLLPPRGRMRRTQINGQPGVLFLDRSGWLIHVLTVDIAAGVVQTVRGIINPGKLEHLGPLADLRALRRRRRASESPR